MASLSAIARRHLAAAIEEAGETGYRPDEVADAALSEAIRVMRGTRSVDDIARELIAAADNIDPNKDYMFMRP